jgi:integrase
MNRRESPDGLPFRVYQRLGKKIYSIGYKSQDGTWTFRIKCSAEDHIAVQKTRGEALKRHASLMDPQARDDSFSSMSEAFFIRQVSFPLDSPQRRAESTLLENRREARNLEKAFGKMNINHFKAMHAYQYLDACEAAGRGPKGNKEISLARLMFENYVRVGKLISNPFTGVRKLATSPSTRVVTEDELIFVLAVGRSAGGTRHLAALALWAGYLCVRRSGELLSLRRHQIDDKTGIDWIANKGQGNRISLNGTITWSKTLREIIDEALSFKRNKNAPTDLVFGNLAGQRYTKGGWKKTLSYLMNDCAAAAKSEGRPFEPFNLRDCRPAGVTEKLNNRDGDVMDATLHTSERMLRTHYDRRRTRIATPTK